MDSYKTKKRIEYIGIFKGVFLGILSILFVLNSFTKVLAADKSDIKLTVRYGYDQSAKYGRYLPVNITLDNQGEEFEGYVQTYASKLDNNVAYEKEIAVKKNETSKITMTVPVIDSSGYLNVKLLNKQKETVISKQYTLKLGNYDKLMYVGVLSNDFYTMDYLTAYGTQVFYLDKTMIPEDRLGLDLLDVLVINQYDSGELNPKQITAISDWIKKGGTLVLGTGENQEEVLRNFGKLYGITSINSKNLTFSFGMEKNGLKELTSKILDYEEARRIFLDTINSQNQMLTAYGLDPIKTNEAVQNLLTKEELNKLKVDKITKEVINFDISGGIRINAQQEDSLLTVKNYGLGKIEVFHFDLGLSKEFKTSGLSILTAIRENMSDSKKTQLDYELYGSYMSNEISNWISHTSKDAKPNILHYTLIIIIYVLISGPILYGILRVFDKSNWYFRLIMMFSLLFMGIVYLMGGNTRINKPYMDYIKVLEYGEKNTLTNNMFFSLTGNSNRGVDVDISHSYDVKELSQSIPYISDYQTLKNLDPTIIKSSITYKDNKTELKLTGLPAFSPVHFQLTKVETAKNNISSDLTNIGYGLVGTIVNNFDYDINNAILVSQGVIVGLGNIAAGKEVKISDKYSIFLSVRDEMYEKEVLEKLTQTKGMYDEAESNRLTSVLQNLIEEDINTLNQDSYLIGFKAKSVNATQVEDTLDDDIIADIIKMYDVYGTEVVKLPVEVNYSTVEETLVPSIDSYIVPDNSFYNKYYQARYLNTPETTLTYHFPADEKIIRFSFIKGQNNESISEYFSKFTGTIKFLNVKTGDFDRVFYSGYNESVYNPENYLSENNSLTIKYSTDMSLKSFNIVLPHISYWKEANNARN